MEPGCSKQERFQKCAWVARLAERGMKRGRAACKHVTKQPCKGFRPQNPGWLTDRENDRQNGGQMSTMTDTRQAERHTELEITVGHRTFPSNIHTCPTKICLVGQTVRPRIFFIELAGIFLLLKCPPCATKHFFWRSL